MKKLFILLAFALLLMGCAIAPRYAAVVEEPVTATVQYVCFTVTPTVCLCPGTPTLVATSTPMVTPTATPQPSTPACWDPRLDQIGVTVDRRNGQYDLFAGWVTIDGQWTDVIACARTWQNDNLGGDHMAFGRVETANGMAIQDTFARVWPGGGDPRLPEPYGWANIPLAGQGWNPANGPGPYDWFVYGGDKLRGIGMPWNNHWSFFAIWRLKPVPTSLHEFDRAIMGAPQSSIVVIQSATTQTGGRMIGLEVGSITGSISIQITVP